MVLGYYHWTKTAHAQASRNLITYRDCKEAERAKTGTPYTPELQALIDLSSKPSKKPK